MSETITRTSGKRCAAGSDEVSRNLVGQKLGRKGTRTRERAVDAMLRLLDDPLGPPVTLAGVAREAAVGVTSLYLYFPGLGDLLLAALRRIQDTADVAFIHLLREYWPDDVLDERCLAFHLAYTRFWQRNARLLHMRNKFDEAFDFRVMTWCQDTALPMIYLLVRQMGGPPDQKDSACFHLALVIVAGMERMASVITNPHFPVAGERPGGTDALLFAEKLMRAEAELVALAVRDQRRKLRALAVSTAPD